MIKEEVVDFLFWLEQAQQENLLINWNNNLVSNSFVAQRYVEWLDFPKENIGAYRD